MACLNCPRKCGVDRNKSVGVCGVGKEIIVNTHEVFMFEEPCISGINGSGVIFFSGCSLKCVYCQNYEISHGANGRKISPSELVEIIKDLEEKGVHNINFVTPTHFIDGIISALQIYRPKIPIVWNTHGYETTENIQKLCDFVDVFLTDFKYFESGTAKKYSSCENYPKIVKNALEIMVKNKPLIWDGEFLKSGVIVRHLALPQRVDETKKILNYLAENYKDKVVVSLMSQFTPFGECNKYPELNRSLTPREHKIINTYFRELDLMGYTQGLSSSTTKYIPKWKN